MKASERFARTNKLAEGDALRSTNTLAMIGDWLKVLAPVAAGCWLVYVYLAHEREQRAVALQTSSVALEQQRITLKMAEISAAAEQERSRLALEHQRLSVEQARTVARYQLDKERLSTSLMQLDRGLKQIDLDSATNSRIGATTRLAITCSADKRSYVIQYEVLIQNNAEKKDVEISWEMRSAFIGVPRAQSDSKSIYMTRLNEPPNPFIGTGSTGPIAWESFGQVAYAYPGTRALADLQRTAFHFAEGGLVTKVIRPRDRAESKTTYLVVAPVGHWVAVVLNIGIDGAIKGDGLFTYSQWQRLPPCDQSQKRLLENAAESALGDGRR